MFTGIIKSVGEIKQFTQMNQGVRLVVWANKLNLMDVNLGDSIAHNGVCLTVVDCDVPNNCYTVDVSPETLACTSSFNQGVKVNLEKALTLNDRLGGHLVSGHVDDVGMVISCQDVGEYYLLKIKAPQELLPYIAKKGSIAVHGVSLTVNAVSEINFELLLIPQTISETNLGLLKIGDEVNLEIDLIARYVARLNEFQRG